MKSENFMQYMKISAKTTSERSRCPERSEQKARVRAKANRRVKKKTNQWTKQTSQVEKTM